jgi:acyl transferase domain-containing protein/glutamate-1-semialdehyde aminotransferase
MSYANAYRLDDGVAIIGMAGRFPGARNVRELWRNLVDRRETISHFRPDELELSNRREMAQRGSADYVCTRGILDDIDLFDAEFFGIVPKEAEVLDPQQRLFLETAWEALEDAGYDPKLFAGQIGVFGGASNNTYLLQNLLGREDVTDVVGWLTTMMGNEKDYLTTRVAYKLDLKGPALNIVTACSTSLVAVCSAVTSLLSHECDMALAGGVSVMLPQRRGYLWHDGAITSRDGHCRAFDHRADGTVFSNGLGVVVLRRLSEAIADGDAIYAVIKGAALNNDGSSKVSFTAPSVDGHAHLIATAQALAGIDPGTISYVEAHGTGTSLGDPIEVAGLTRAFRAGGALQNGFCQLGSIKTNIGHLDAAAGIAGLIKTVMALYHKVIPATLHFEAPNPKLELADTPFYVSAETRTWETHGIPRRAGVSSFGVGGTNAHVVLEEAPALAPLEPSRQCYLFVISARSADALEAASVRLRERLSQDEDIDPADVAYTLQIGRRAFEYRRAIVCGNRLEAIETIGGSRPRHVVTKRARTLGGIAFMFPGQGVQHVGMGRQLYETEPLFRREVDESCEVLAPFLGLNLRSVLFPGPECTTTAQQALAQTAVTQPALFVIEHALARLWISWGVRPAAMIGHSLGEYVAACLGGTFDRDSALRLLARRASLMQSLPSGSMLAIKAPAEQLMESLSPAISIAAFNSPNLVVVSGEHDAISELKKRLQQKGIANRLLQTSHAFHSSMMEPIVSKFADIVRSCSPKSPQLPWISSLTGAPISDREAADPDYWAQQLRQPVRFTDGIRHLLDPSMVLLEVGPGQTLATLARQQPGRQSEQVLIASLPEESDALDRMQMALGQLWCSGIKIDWSAFNERRRRRRISLPTYPFERRRYWISSSYFGDAASSEANVSPIPVGEEAPAQAAQQEDAMNINTGDSNALLLSSLTQLFSDLSGLDVQQIDPKVPFVELGLDSLVLTQAVGGLQKRFGVKVTFRELLDDCCSIDALVRRIAPIVPARNEQDHGNSCSVKQTAMFEATSSLTTSAVQSTVPALARDALSLDAGNLNELLSQNLRVMARQLDLLNQLIGSRAVETVAHTLSATSAISIPSPPPPAYLESASKGNQPGPKPFGPYRPPAKDGKRQHTPEQQRSLDEFTRRYCDRTAQSKQLTAKHRPHLADPRSVAGFRQNWKEIVYPIVVDRSLGSSLWDVDGNEYVDLVNGFGSVFFGHNPEFIRDALKEQLDRGVEIGPQSPMAGEVAKLICDMVGMERAAFCNTGSEAVTAAIRVARTVTGRDRIVMFAGAYHGIFDEVLVRSSPRDLSSKPIAPGIPTNMAENIVVLDYGTDAALETISKQSSELAAVLVEPVQSRRPDLQPREFLAALRKITAGSGTALVFDEVVTGFRIHPGGAQEVFGISADIATYGKVVGGGLPIGIVAGRSKFLDALDGGMWSFGDASMPEIGVTFFAGTFVRHPLALAAARSVLLRLRESGPGLQRELNLRTTQFVDRLNRLAQEAGAPVRVKHFASWFMFELPRELQFAPLFFAFMRGKGVHIWEGRPGFLTLAHSDADLDRMTAAFAETLAEMQASMFLPTLKEVAPLDGARKGRDASGKPAWFVPDPDRPGKYLQVRSDGPL